MSYTHLTTTERVEIETYLGLGRQSSTVSREIRRNTG